MMEDVTWPAAALTQFLWRDICVAGPLAIYFYLLFYIHYGC